METQNLQKLLQELSSRAKPLPDLLVREKFSVEFVTAETYVSKIIPYSNLTFGGPSQSQQGGYQSKLTLKVKPENPKIPIDTLIFFGLSNIEGEDQIIAQIPRYQERHFSSNIGLEANTLYFDREYQSKEMAIELVKLSSDGKPLRCDKAVNYSEFIK